tara:strand:- start:1825 stop:2082 length:258 start_codon:yes stop_codon:yes gene_type:complete
MNNDRSGFDSRIGNSLKYFQKIIIQSGPAATGSYTLIGSIIICAVLGWLVDTINESSPQGILIGIFLGLISGFYQLAKIIWGSNK